MVFRYFKIGRLKTSIRLDRMYFDYGIAVKLHYRVNEALPDVFNLKFQLWHFNLIIMIYKINKRE